MKRNDEFASWGKGRKIWGASGLQGFFGEGYRFHFFLLKLLWGGFKGMTFVAKTATAKERTGNMPLNADGITTVKLFPDCVYINPWLWLKGAMLNAVGLSNKGIDFLLNDGRWQQRTEPFMISIMPVGDKPEERRCEVKKMVAKIRSQKFNAPVAIQLNISCPNTGHDIKELEKEVMGYMEEMGKQIYPVVVKVNPLFPIELAKQISEHLACAGLSPSNTLAFGDAPNTIPWKKLFGTSDPGKSPLKKRGFGAGGFSGRYLLPLELEWIRKAREAGITCHINCGSCFSPKDVRKAYQAGADSISLGTVALHRPWMVRSVIRTAIYEE
jgi:dihydroorotate dehydrogenase